MRHEMEELSCRNKEPIDLVSAVKELHILSSQELSKLIRDADDDVIQWTASNGSSKQIKLETLARYLPWHLIAKLLQSKRDEELFRYLLGGLRLLHALYDLAPRNSKLEQVLLEDMKVAEQMFDLIFFIILVLSGFKQESQLALLHSALLACSLYLITAFVSSQWNELAPVLLAHPKVDIFVFGSVAAVHRDIQFILVRLSGNNGNTSMQSNLAEVNRLCQHCEASLQFLQSLCQQRLFRERLVKNKDLCEEGGILLLAHDIMKLPFCEDSYLMAVFSRLKSKVLTIVLHLCEVESVSFLDVAASTTKGLDLAKSTISQVLELLKVMFRGDLNGLASFTDRTYPRGLLQLNAMRLTDILSDDSNFRSYITLNFTDVLATIFLQPHVDFLSSWCSSGSRPSEDDATLDYDSFIASGWVLGVLTSSDVPESTFNASRVPRTSYAFQRTSLLVKVVANLTCFIPDICREEKDLFLNTFMQCLQKELPNLPHGLSSDSRTERAAIVNQNLRSLSVHAESLIPGFLNHDDVQLFRLFIAQLDDGFNPLNMPIYRITIGTPAEASHPDTLKAGLAEFISTFIFVFAGQGSGMAYSKLTYGAPNTPDGLVAAALSHAFALFVAVSVSANISGGHVNPAVTLASFVGGNISFFSAVVYWIGQLAGSVVACLFLQYATGGMETAAFGLATDVSNGNALVFEIVMTFGLVYTVYATAVDPKKGNIGILAPLAIGLIVGANILAGGAFDGASMNPAVCFGPAVVSWTWDHHWVYWAGPFLGATIAALIYDNILIGEPDHIPVTDY